MISLDICWSGFDPARALALVLEPGNSDRMVADVLMDQVVAKFLGMLSSHWDLIISGRPSGRRQHHQERGVFQRRGESPVPHQGPRAGPVEEARQDDQGLLHHLLQLQEDRQAPLEALQNVQVAMTARF